MQGGRVGINLNGVRGEFFRTYRGLRQSHPLSPILFNLVVDALATMLESARDAGEIKGLVPHLVNGGLTHLQYAYDTVLFLQVDDQPIINTKFIFYCFECMPGLKANYQKSEISLLGVSEDEWLRVADMFNRQVGSLPMKYLVIPVSDNKLTISDSSFLPQKVEKRPGT